ncbi:hypothetical protein [Roseibium sp.]|uniref:hypothetical protein n=1 Tax=Roseibium sp. TaxID=1936156 RepID=UPI003A96CD55
MLQAMYDVFDRQRRPLRNRHYMVFRKARVGYARIPGAPMATVFPVLKMLSGLAEDPHATQAYTTDYTGLWDGDIELLTASELKRRHPDFPVFTIVQYPHSRLAACYEHLILGDTDLPAYFEESRFRKQMPVNEFLERVLETTDLVADNLLRSQASILHHKGLLVPDLILDFNKLPSDWSKLRSLLKRQSNLDIGEGPAAIEMPTHETAEAIRNSQYFGQVLRHYRRDYKLFFENRNDGPTVRERAWKKSGPANELNGQASSSGVV